MPVYILSPISSVLKLPFAAQAMPPRLSSSIRRPAFDGPPNRMAGGNSPARIRRQIVVLLKPTSSTTSFKRRIRFNSITPLIKMHSRLHGGLLTATIIPLHVVKNPRVDTHMQSACQVPTPFGQEASVFLTRFQIYSRLACITVTKRTSVATCPDPPPMTTSREAR